jgi:hypothetical protein
MAETLFNRRNKRPLPPKVLSDRGKSYAEFIDAQLQAEESRRASITSRAATALNGATGFVTLVLAVCAIFLGKDFLLTDARRRRFVSLCSHCLLELVVQWLRVHLRSTVRRPWPRRKRRWGPAGLRRALGGIDLNIERGGKIRTPNSACSRSCGPGRIRRLDG